MSHLTLDEKKSMLKGLGIIPTKVKNKLYYFDGFPMVRKNGFYAYFRAINIETEKTDAIVRFKISSLLNHSPKKMIKIAKQKLINKLRR